MISRLKMRKKSSKLLVLLVLFFNACSSISLNNENDALGFAAKNRDMLYSQGFKLTVTRKKSETAETLKTISEKIPDLNILTEQSEPSHYSLTVGQDIYTPDNLALSELQPEQNPYAGWLYVRLAKMKISENQKKTSALSVGMVGPASFAKEVQTEFHDFFEMTHPNGWDHQLNNEFGVILENETETRNFQAKFLNHKFEQSYGLNSRFGNIHTDSAVFVTHKIGKHYQSFKKSIDRQYSYYLYNQFKTSVIAKNIFLDGNTFSDSHSVDKSTMVGHWQYGVAVEYNSWLFKIYQTVQTKVFKEQDKDYHVFGGFQITKLFD